ncbi:hypothetical protein BGZ93_008403 [Podila epicladia]|nr:hypothetical protein BGZ93_008403 [Podila epicladia]
MFGSAFGANGGANPSMKSGNTNNTGNAFDQYPSNQSNWNGGGAGNDGGTRGRGRGANYRGRGGANRGSSNMTYVAPSLANGNTNHQQHQQQQQFQQPFQRGRGGGGYVPRGRGRGVPGQFRSMQWRPNNSNAQNTDMDDDMASDLTSDSQWTTLSTTVTNPTSSFSAFASTPTTFTAASGSAFNSISGQASSTFNSAGPIGSAFSSSAPSAFSAASGFQSTPTSTFNTTTNSSSALPASGPSFAETKEKPSGSAFGGTTFGGSAFGNSPSMAAKAPSTFSPKTTNQNSRSALINSSLSSSTSAPSSSTLRSIPKFQDQEANTPEDAESRLARFSAVPIGNRYEELKERRVLERQEAIRKGAIPDPDKPRRLEDAITFVGTCQDMCPEFERHEREYQQSVESFEKIPGTDSIDHSRAVKIYARSAAGNEQALPSDVRPPAVLLSTLEYLIKEIVAKGELADSHAFVRDRTRSIRQDFTLQNSRGLEAIEAHEIIARYHILCIHQLCEVKSFSQQQEMEQLRKVLTSLQEFYDDMRAEGIPCPNEAEFRAYHMLSHMWDPDMLRQAQQLPRHIFQDPFIQAATELHTMSRRNNDIRRRAKTQSEASPNLFSRFFKKIAGGSVTYLMACLVETSFAEIRKGALKAINKSYLDRHGGIPIDDVMDMLGFDDVEECIENCQEYELEISYENRPSVVVNRRVNRQRIFKEGTTGFKQRRSMRIVEAKREAYSAVQIIYGETPGPTNRTGSMPKPSSVQRPITTFTPQRKQPIAASGASLTGMSNLPTPAPVLARLPAATQPLQAGIFNFGIDTSTKPALPQVPPSAGSQSVFGKQPIASTVQFGLTASGPPSMLVPSAPAVGLGVSSSLSPLASSFKPITPSPLQPALSIPPPSAVPFSTVPQPPQFNFAPSQAAVVTAKPPAFEFKAPAIPSTPPVPMGAVSFSTPPAKSLSGFSGTVSTAPFSISTGAANATPVLIPPPSPISTPKTDAITIVTKRGRIYPRSVVESVWNEIQNDAIDRFTRSIVAQVHHDTSVERSIRRAEERKHAVRIEEIVIMNGIMEHAMRQVFADVCSEIYRETKLQRWVIRKWRAFAIKSRKRAEELKRRQDHYLANVRAMSSRAGLGEDEMAIKIREYKAEQDRINRRPRPHVDQEDYPRNAKNNIGVKSMVEAVNQKRRRLMVLDQEGSPDNALLVIMKEAAAPHREMWAPVLIQEIVERQYQLTHPSRSESKQHHPWRLFVNTPDFKDMTSKWLMTKLGTEMGRSTKIHQRSGHMTTSHRRTQTSGMDVVVHGFVDESLQDLTTLCPPQTIMETSALIFVFSKVPFADDEATESAINHYWDTEKLRLARFLSCFKGIKQPLVLVMWGEQSMWETLSPYAVRSLELDTIMAAPGSGVARYSFLVMDLMSNMKLDRYIAGALEWLAAETRDLVAGIEDQSARLSRIALD